MASAGEDLADLLEPGDHPEVVMLPAGTYTYGTVTFEVEANPDRVKLKLKSKAP